MYNDDLSLLETEEQNSNSSSSMDLGEPKSDIPPPDPEQMLTLLSHPESSQRMLAARAFCEIEDPRAIPYLIKLLEDICPLVRVSTAYALGRNTSTEAVQPLIDLLASDWNGYVRKGIVWALGNSKDLSIKRD